MFRIGTLLFALGIIVALAINSVASYFYLIPLSLLCSNFFFKPSFKYAIFAFSAGFVWLLFNLHYYQRWVLPFNLQKQPLKIIAEVTSVPEYQDHKLSFLVKTREIQTQAVQAKLKLDWYLYQKKIPDIHVGQSYEFTVKLERPHGLMNPGGFDYVAWLVESGIQATGYILNAEPLTQKIQWSINRVREQIKNNIHQILGDRELVNFIVALAVGVRENIQREQWQVLQNTGTNHLIAIAGLHIGLVTGLIFFVFSYVWRNIPGLPLWIPAQQVAAAAALSMAWIYAALAGFSLPTERAVIMLTMFFASIMGRFFILPWTAWCLALLFILVLNPVSILSVEFWLSFAAVAIIILLSNTSIGSENKWIKLSKIQFGLALGLIPITLLFFHQASLIAPIANLIAIPIVGFLTVPLSLLGALFSLISLTLAKPLIFGALHTLYWAWAVLNYFSDQPWFSFSLSLNAWQTGSVFLGLLLIFVSKIPLKHLGLIFILPLFIHPTFKPKMGSCIVTILDVGQGLSVFVQTYNHNLIYDTGASYGVSYDMGQAVLIPYLAAKHIRKLDTIVISHGDNDHIGGLSSLLKIYPTQNILTSVPARIPNARLCLAGQHWSWDGVDFDMLYPDAMHLNLDNNSSCVLRITVGGRHVLLTGDIEKISETYLVETEVRQLAADIIVAPHHGSKTSSSLAFLEAVHPYYVVFPAGNLNRFHFPSANIVQRYADLGAKAYDTGQDGAITFLMTPDNLSFLENYRTKMYLRDFR